MCILINLLLGGPPLEPQKPVPTEPSPDSGRSSLVCYFLIFRRLTALVSPLCTLPSTLAPGNSSVFPRYFLVASDSNIATTSICRHAHRDYRMPVSGWGERGIGNLYNHAGLCSCKIPPPHLSRGIASRPLMGFVMHLLRRLFFFLLYFLL